MTPTKKTAPVKKKAPAPKKAAARKPAPAKPTRTQKVLKAAGGGDVMAAYLKTLEPWQVVAVRAIEKLVTKEAPGCVTVIKYGHPVFERSGKPFAMARAQAKHVVFGFWNSKNLVDPDGRLLGGSLKHFEVKEPKDVAPAYVAQFLREALKMNNA